MKERREVDYEAKAVTLAAALERQLKKGDKSLVGNKGYRRFLADPQGDGFAIDRAKVEEDAKFDGVFVLRSNANLSPPEAMLVYKQEWTVDIDQAWRLSRIRGGGGDAVGGLWRQAGQGGGVARIAFNAAIVPGSARTSTARFEPEPRLRRDRRPFWTQV